MPGPYYPGYVSKGDISQVSSTLDQQLGTFAFERGRILQYVKFGGSVKRYNWVGMLETATGEDSLNTITALYNQATHSPLGVCEYGGTAGSYGWITRSGGATAQVAATSAIGSPLGPVGSATGTLGTLQSATILQGMVGAGIVVGTPSATGTYVNVRCM